MFGRHLEHPRTSTGIVAEDNIVRTPLNIKNGITTMPVVSAAGDKLPMQVVVKGTTNRCVRNRHLPDDMAGDYSPTGWQTEESFIRYIKQHIIPYFNGVSSCLVVDKFSAHMTDAVKKLCDDSDIELLFVPAHMTHALQPLDIGVNRELRQRARREWITQQIEGKENEDPGGAAATRLNNAMHAVKSKTITHAWDASAKYVPEL